jgi:hypothetical protein
MEVIISWEPECSPQVTTMITSLEPLAEARTEIVTNQDTLWPGLFCFFFSWWYWDLNSSVLPLKPCLQSSLLFFAFSRFSR